MAEEFIPMDKKSMWKTIVIGVIAIAVCTFLIWKGYEPDGLRDYGHYIYYGTSVFALIAAIIGNLVIAAALKKPDLGLHISDIGIQFRGGLSDGLVYRWTDIIRFKGFKTKQLQLIFVYLREEPEPDRAFNWWQKWNQNSDVKLFGTPHKIQTAMLKLDHDELLRLLNEKLREFNSRPR